MSVSVAAGVETLSVQAALVENDVTGLDRVPVSEVVNVTCSDDVVSAVLKAKGGGLCVAARGTGHSMGGHCLPRNGILLDMSGFSKVRTVDVDQKFAVVEAGATWGDLIASANEHGLSPTVMQSYCTFSVGGSLSVNVHGGSSDDSLHSAVSTLEVVTVDGQIVRTSRGDHLYKHVVGGYGLFGIILTATVDLIPNVRLEHRGIMFSSDETFFKHYMTKTLANPSIVIKRGRLDLNSASAKRMIYEFEKVSEETDNVVSTLPERPRELTRFSRFMFKWILPTPAGREIRRAVERVTHSPADFQPKYADSFNRYLYESAKSISHLYAGMIKLPDTFVLHEYFIPMGREALLPLQFTKEAREIIRAWKKKHWQHRFVRPVLLNTSVRTVNQDNVTALPYAPVNSIAFVLYFRFRPSSEYMLQELHDELVKLALRKGGTFYLPYRLHYSDEQLLDAYPQFDSFRKAKRKLDACNVFSNEWWNRYKHAG